MGRRCDCGQDLGQWTRWTRFSVHARRVSTCTVLLDVGLLLLLVGNTSSYDPNGMSSSSSL